MRLLVSALLSISLLTSCTISQKIKYEGVNAQVQELPGKIIVTVHDQRAQVVAGRRKPNFVGYMRSTAGIAYPMSTQSKQPFAAVIADDIALSITKSGGKAQALHTTSKESQSDVVTKLKSAGGDKSVYLICNQLHTDGWGVQTLYHQLQLNIYDSNGKLLAQKEFTGKRGLGGVAFWGPGFYKKYMPVALATLIKEIFNDPEVVEALKAETQVTAAIN